MRLHVRGFIQTARSATSASRRRGVHQQTVLDGCTTMPSPERCAAKPPTPTCHRIYEPGAPYHTIAST